MTDGAPDPREELAELAAAVRAYVEWQADTGATGLPVEDAGAANARLAGTSTASAASAASPRAASPPRAAVPAEAASFAQAPIASPRSFDPPASPPAAPPPVAKPAPPPAAKPASPAAPDERRTRLSLIAEEVRSCTACVLHEQRNHTVFSRGNPFAELCFIGEGPGADEDRLGEPFVGAAGQLLDRMIAAMGYHRDEVYICNIVKCRPPNNRKPEPAEMKSCMPFLVQQLGLVQPKVIVALGATAVQGLIGTSEGITRMRGKWKLYKGSVPIMPTFHPAYLLRSPAAKRDVWNDLQEVMKHLGKTPPAR